MADLGRTIPERGARILLERLAVEADGARYRVTLSTALSTGARQWIGELSIGADTGNVTLTFPDDPPTGLADFTKLLARSLWRQRQDSPWPRRVTRWREQR